MDRITVFHGFGQVVTEVARTLIPLGALFTVFQVFCLKLPRAFVRRVVTGIVWTFVGLSLFLQGVNIAFMPLGRALGSHLGKLGAPAIVLPVGFVLGMLVVLAEPSARVLSGEVERPRPAAFASACSFSLWLRGWPRWYRWATTS